MQSSRTQATRLDQHHIYLDRVGIAVIPDNYDSWLVEMFPGAFENLRLMALDPYDLALSKLERNSQKDRDDVSFLAGRVPLDLAVLELRLQFPESCEWTVAEVQEDRERYSFPGISGLFHFRVPA